VHRSGHGPRRRIDADAYRGTRGQFATLIGLAPPGEIQQIHRNKEDSEMYVETAAPGAGTAKRDWPTRRVSLGFDPRGGWGGQLAVKLHWGAPGGWVHEAKWWVRGGTGVGIPNQPHSPVAINVNGVAERYVGLGWELYPPERADELEVVISAPGGCHIFPFYEK
jgi:CubicO group peptidase (beta-lactamase class C family)